MKYDEKHGGGIPTDPTDPQDSTDCRAPEPGRARRRIRTEP